MEDIYNRPLTSETKWIVCMWDIKGDTPYETAKMLKRSLKQIHNILDECKKDGYYEKVRRHIEYFEIINAKYPLPSIKKIIECEKKKKMSAKDDK